MRSTLGREVLVKRCWQLGGIPGSSIAASLLHHFSPVIGCVLLFSGIASLDIFGISPGWPIFQIPSNSNVLFLARAWYSDFVETPDVAIQSGREKFTYKRQP